MMSTSHSILLVDDEEVILESVGRALGKKGYAVTMAGSGEEAVEKLKSNKYQLVITDLMMPGLSGIDVLKETKNTSPETAVIILTAHGSLASVLEARILGVSDYVLKLIDTGDLFLRVANALEKFELQRRARDLEAELEAAREELKRLKQP